MTEIEKGEINVCLYSLKKGAYGVCMGETIGIFLEAFTRKNEKHTENFVVKFLGFFISHEILHREINKEGIRNVKEEAVREVTRVLGGDN